MIDELIVRNKIFNLKVPTIKGIRNEIAYNILSFPYNNFKSLPICSKKLKSYINVPCAFDIETTSLDGEKNEKGEYIKSPYGFMYHWQFCILDTVCFGRTWEEFKYFINRIKKTMGLNFKRNLVVYCHNLSFEFHFLKDFFKISSLFAKEEKKPIKANIYGIEFRCSYFLSNMSLKKFCENSKGVIHYKMDGDNYDYSKLRTPATPMTNEELSYCYNDVRGLCECISYLMNDDNLANIPLTNTGYVRREYRKVMQGEKLRKIFENLALNENEYELCKRAFRGGNTHANRYFTGQKLSNVYSFDIASSYPSCIMMDDFPMGKFTKVKLDSPKKTKYFMENYCVVCDIEFKDLELKKNQVIPYIDVAHCYKRFNVVNDNGRVISAEYVKLSITNIDFNIIQSMYKNKGFRISNAIFATKGKLPKELRTKMMEFFYDKTMLKDVEGKEYEYMKSKNRLNSTFGMMVTDIAHSTITYDPVTHEWEENKPAVEGALEQFYNSRNNFLSYQWGVFVTANARKRLQDMLDVIGSDVIYIDTDSIKFKNEKHIKEFEKKNKELIKIAESNDIKSFVDREINGKTKRYYLGIWDNDGVYKEFKTFGAKKYAVTKMKKGKEVFEITVSGMSKSKGSKVVGNMDNFALGKTYRDIGRTTSWYNEAEPHKITVDGCTFTTASNIGLLETSYTLGITNEYWEIIKSLNPNLINDSL